MLRRLLLTVATSSFLLACAPDSPSTAVDAGEIAASQARDQALAEWFDEKYEEYLSTKPMTLTQLGRKERYGDLGDFSEDGWEAEAQWWADTAAELATSFDREALSAEAQLSYDLWMAEAESYAEARPFRSNAFLFTQMQGMHSYLPSFMISLHRVESREDMEAYISRLQGFDEALGELTDRAEANAAAGARPPLFAYDIVMEEARNIITGAPFTEGEPSALSADAQEKIAALLDAGEIDQDTANRLEGQARDALIGHVGPAYDRLIAFLETDRENADAVPQGVSALPNGPAFYDYKLNEWTTTDLTADEIHEIGLAEVARLRAAMDEVKESVGFDGDFGAFSAHVRNAEWNYYPDNDEGRQAYIDDATAAIEGIEETLPDYFGLLPKAPLEVRRVEAFREQDGAAQHYRRGSPDGERPGIYYAHLSDMGAMPKHELEVIAYHEGLPGHHMQISIAQELEGVPLFRRQYFSGAYIEGWALYTEAFAKEIPGTYQDPYSEYGRLASEMWRAIRLVVDTGLHVKGWSEEEAVQYFLDNSPTTETTVRSEIRRYLVLPGQATSYKIGMLKIQELRAMAEEELGGAFDIRGFHDAVLGGGALPLPLLETRVRDWIESEEG